MWLEISALIPGLFILAFLAHELTTNLDVGFAFHRRMITAGEQSVHDYFIAIPLTMVMIICVSHPEQFAALLGAGHKSTDFLLRWKKEIRFQRGIWRRGWCSVPFNAPLYLEEFVRYARASQTRKSA